MRAVGPNYARPQLPSPPQYRFVESAARPQSLADAPWWQVFDDPTLQALIQEAIANNLDLRTAVARVEEARARAGIAKSFLYPQVDGVASYGVRQASNARSEDESDDEDTTHQSGDYGFQLSWELDLFGRLRRAARSRAGAGAGERAGPPRRARHARRRRRVATTSCCASSTCSSRSRGRRCASTTRPSPTSRTGWTAACRTGSSSTASRPTARRPRPRSPRSSSRSRIVENALSLLLGRPPGPIARERARAGEAAAAADSARPAGVAARAAARRRAGRAAAGGGQRRHRRRQGAVLSDDQPDRLSRRRQRRSHDVPRRRRRGVVGRRRAAAAGVPGRAPSPEPRGGAGALRRGARRVPEGGAQRLPRSRQLAGHDPEAGRGARAAADRRDRAAGRRPTWPARATTPGSPATSRS